MTPPRTPLDPQATAPESARGSGPVSLRYAPGLRIAGKYRLVRQLGEGGMGAVWLARNEVLEADVAIKLIRRGGSTPTAKARLLQEARAAARLAHPGIVRVFDFGQTEQGDPFLVMELLSGESLGDLLTREGRLPATDAVALIVPVGRALSVAHERGIVHRDLKPDNVQLVEEEGGVRRPKLVDFGLAKSGEEGFARGLTAENTVVGSPGYMSPEQARGRSELDRRADIWAFTVMLYEMITGKLPFDGPNYNALLTSIILDEPAPTTDLGAGDAELWSIVERGLAKAPDERWQSMDELLSALCAWAIARGCEEDVTGARMAAEPRRGTLPSLSGASSPSSPRPKLANQAHETLAGGEAPAGPPPTRRPLHTVGAAVLLALSLTAWGARRMGGAPSSSPRSGDEAADAHSLVPPGSTPSASASADPVAQPPQAPPVPSSSASPVASTSSGPKAEPPPKKKKIRNVPIIPREPNY